jgi:ribosomal peptide maturation radical SAM protein 1
MAKAESPPPCRVALVSMPWQDPFSPSIQLGTLSAWLARERAAVRIDCFDLFLELASDIGLHLSKRISISWIGEALFAYLLFPQQRGAIERFLEKSRDDDPMFRDLDYDRVINALRIGLVRRLDAVDWSAYDVIGLSVVFSQTMATLLASREIKRRSPDAVIALGGPGVTGKIGASLLRSFDFLDYIVNGEGERPLVDLVDALIRSPRDRRLRVKGVFHRHSDPQEHQEVNQLPDMAGMPVPDYSSYFQRLERLPGGREAKGRVRVPVETNRGCWWDLSLKNPMQSCSFCNLNLQWHGYRERPVKESAALFAELNRRHQCPDFTVVDNILRHHLADDFIAELNKLDLGLDLWMEARASVKPEQVVELRRAGARVIQFGIEALSSGMLKKMVKGTNTIQNLQAMKLCEQYGIQNSANLIIDFPGMDEADIIEELENISFARAFYPLSTTSFSLVYQAPAYKQPAQFGIENIRSYEMYRMLLPPDLYETVFLTEQSFDSERLDRLRPLWQRVQDAAEDWQAHYERMRDKVEGRLLLSIQDGGNYLKVRDFRWPVARFHWLEGAERDVYLECSTTVSRRKLYARFPEVPAKTIDGWIARWREVRIAFTEDGKVLALAIPWGPVSARRTSQPAVEEHRPTAVASHDAAPVPARTAGRRRVIPIEARNG